MCFLNSGLYQNQVYWKNKVEGKVGGGGGQANLTLPILMRAQLWLMRQRTQDFKF